MALAGCGGSGGAGPFAEPGDDGSVGLTNYFDLTPGWIVPNDMLVLGPISSEAVLIGVRLQHPEDARGLRIRFAAMQLHGSTMSGGRGWHPARWHAHPVNGFVVKPHTTAAIWVGVSGAKPGNYSIRGLVVDYRVGDTQYSVPEGLGWGVCVRPHINWSHPPSCGD
jgi:hypothetical protein